MRTHLNERAKQELIFIANARGYNNLTHCLNVVISEALKAVNNTQTQFQEVNRINGSCTTQQ